MSVNTDARERASVKRNANARGLAVASTSLLASAGYLGRWASKEDNYER